MTEVFYAVDHILMSQGYDNPAPHKHMAKHLIFSLDGDFGCKVDDMEIFCQGICIDSEIKHTVNADGSRLLIFLFEETSNLAEELTKQFLIGGEYKILDHKLVLSIIKIWERYKQEPVTLDLAILSACGLCQESSGKYEERVCRLLESVRKMDGIYDDTICLLSKSLSLSQSRMSHLFKEQVGIALNSYLIFEKMRKAYTYIVNGENITKACIRAGFDSSSHFSSTCKRMFGLSFTDFKKDAVFKEIS
ncbi:helix-turn-helix domain-containing protein [Anaerocolumna sp. MB42-C2]|uniref:helix-turn-helix domain-containing protein n=1 Tax=Anaerocolumna sp. MB42-C2 TaxID=3070997 RepID=UPI0027E047C3|nr:helix-turn-helix domain-containing protein [Anaerocolumna sp. MB42-C2]WMJ87086.1 helix-turn-helix domain-containing protein [Anaerocolumna sp. MB42-C2]